MSSLWRARPIFLTSTFRDFHAERDHLRNVVFPALEERLRARRHYLEPIDLRWGVETTAEAEAQAKEMLVLKVCLAEVERSRPFLIGLLGDRYGWIPSKERMAAAAQEAGFDGDLTDRSVTDLEIDFGVLSRAEQQPRCFFYFRDPLPYTAMPPEVAADYSERHGAGGEPAQAHIDQLKQRIEKELPKRVRHYTAQWNQESNAVTGLDQWGLQVLEDLWAELDNETAAFAAVTPSWQENERYLLEEFIEERSRHFIGREGLVKELINFATAAKKQGDDWGVCIEAATGAGKSALFAKLHRDLGNQNIILLAHATGISPQASSVDSMLKRWIEELAGIRNLPNPLTEETKSKEVEKTFHRLLHQASLKKRVVLLVDALNQFESSQYLTWLPKNWPENARLIATAIPSIQTEALKLRAGVRIQSLSPLGHDEAEAIASSICARYRRTLNPDVLQALIKKQTHDQQIACGNPLWLTLAMEELNLLDADDFARAEKQFSGTPEQKLYQLLLSTANEIPPTVPELYGRMLERAQELHGKHWANGFATLIAVSNFGWRELDFVQLLPKLTSEPWDPLRFASLRRTFRAQVTQRGNRGQWDFVHAQLRAAVLTQLLPNDTDRQQTHRLIAEHLLALPKDDPVHETETMVHLISADDKVRAARYLTKGLTRGENIGALIALGSHLVECASGEHDQGPIPGHHWLLSLLKVTELDDDELHKLCKSLVFLELGTASVILPNVRMDILTVAACWLQTLSDRHPHEIDYQRSQCHCAGRVGRVAEELEWLPEALNAYSVGLAIEERLAKDDSHNTEWQHDIAVARFNIGNVHMTQNELPVALEAFQASLSIWEILISRKPDVLQHQHGVAITQKKIGDIAKLQMQLTDALTAYQKALTKFEHLVSQEHVDNALWRLELWYLYIECGDVLRTQGNLPQALASYDAALEFSEHLIEQDPDGNAWANLVATYSKIGEILVTEGRFAKALGVYQKVLAINERLVNYDPGKFVWQRGLAACHERIGNVFMAQEMLLDALAAYKAAQVVGEQLVRKYPDNTECQYGLAATYKKVGDNLLAQGLSSQAVEPVQAAVALAERLVRHDPTNMEWQGLLLANQAQVGDLLMGLGEFAKGLKAYEALHLAFDLLATGDPANMQWQQGLWVSKAYIAEAYLNLGNLNEALEAFESCRAIFERLPHDISGQVEIQGRIAVSFHKLAGAFNVATDSENAIRCLIHCRDILRQLSQLGFELDPWQMEVLEGLDRVLGDGAKIQAGSAVADLDIPTPHPNADPNRTAQLNIQYQEELARWNALPRWKRLMVKKPEPPKEI